jgi:fluoride ion exporter CrcB/FEX
MVLMMDGSANPYLGSQILAAIFGYILGLQACIGSFRAGRAVAAWCHKRRNPYVFDSTMTQHELRQRCHYMHLYWMTPVAIFIIYATLLALYVLGDVYLGIPYYRQLWLACLVAPFGTILRWKLSLLNGKFNFPAGTFLANVIASILSAALSASGIVVSSNKSAIRWGMPLIKAASLGIAGSMSTVSTFVKECHELEEKNQAFDPKAFLYSYGTLIICCFGGLMVYSPIVRNAD